MVTIDASVLVAANAADDTAHAESLTFLQALVRSGTPIHQPTLTLVEISAAIARRTHDATLAREAGVRLLRLPRLVVHPLDLEAAADAAALAGEVGLRGADAVYAATALRVGAALVSLDLDLVSRSAPIIDSLSPAGWVARQA